MENRLAEGNAKITDIAKDSKVFPPLFVWLLAQGGEDLAAGFKKAMEIYSARASYRIELLLYVTLPVSMLVLGTVILGQFLPLFRVLIMTIDQLGDMEVPDHDCVPVVAVDLADFMVAPLALLSWIACYLVSLPLRRQERARFFLDLLDHGLKEGHTPEQAIVTVSRSRDPSMGARFHLLAAHLETGLRLGAALDKVPRLLPLQTVAMLKSGEEIGDVRKVLPACRHRLTDGLSRPAER